VGFTILRVTREELEAIRAAAADAAVHGWTEEAWTQRVSEIVGFDVGVVRPLGIGSVSELELEEVPGRRPPLVRLVTQGAPVSLSLHGAG
jgi:hypothetical protein